MAVLTDPISDFLTRLKNASRAGNESFTAPYSKIKAEIARILKEEGYIWSHEVNWALRWFFYPIKSPITIEILEIR